MTMHSPIIKAESRQLSVIKPQAKSGWDFRHDAMARLIVDEFSFSLKLPRDGELIRQLAFIRVQQGAAHVIPFGKYRGHLLEEIFDDDPAYLEWLAEQEWFRTKFEVLHAAIINFDDGLESNVEPTEREGART